MASTSQGTGSKRDSAAARAAGGDVAGAAAGASAAVATAAAGPVAGTSNAKKPQNWPPALAEKPAGLPPGKYKLIGWDFETTGRRLMDETIQIAAYTPPNKNFHRYIMPHGDLNGGARRRYKVRVVTKGRYRMLQDTEQHTIIKTKTEISALIEFLNWLESIKEKTQMILLIYHDPRRLNPTFLIQSLLRYRLFDRFKTLVAGFTDSYTLCAEMCRGTFKSVSLRDLSLLLLDEELSDHALDKARAVYNVVEQLANQAGDYLDVGAGDEAAAFTGPSEEMLELAREFARPVYTEVAAFETLKDLLEKQDTFRLAFGPLLRLSRHNRHRLMELRRHLTDAGLLYDQVKDAWHEGRRAGLENLLVPLEQTVSPEDIQELVDLFVKHFCLAREPSVVPHSLTDDSDEPPDQTSDSDNSGLEAEFFGLEEELDLIPDF